MTFSNLILAFLIFSSFSLLGIVFRLMRNVRNLRDEVMHLSAQISRFSRETQSSTSGGEGAQVQLMDQWATIATQENSKRAGTPVREKQARLDVSGSKVSPKVEKDVELPLLADKLDQLDFKSVFSTAPEGKTEVAPLDETTGQKKPQ